MIELLFTVQLVVLIGTRYNLADSLVGVCIYAVFILWTRLYSVILVNRIGLRVMFQLTCGFGVFSFEARSGQPSLGLNFQPVQYWDYKSMSLCFSFIFKEVIFAILNSWSLAVPSSASRTPVLEKQCIICWLIAFQSSHISPNLSRKVDITTCYLNETYEFLNSVQVESFQFKLTKSRFFLELTLCILAPCL